jgi:hypothetical protein
VLEGNCRDSGISRAGGSPSDWYCCISNGLPGCITDVGSVYCEVRSVSDVTPVLRSKLHGNASMTGIKNEYFGQSRGMGKKKNHFVFKGLKQC